MKKIFVLSLFLPALALAQTPDKSLFPGTAAQVAPESPETQEDTVVVYHDEPKPEYIEESAEFRSGKGAAVDTLEIGDGRLCLVLKDDHTWYYIKNLAVIAKDSTFVNDWEVNSLAAYKEPLDSLPYRCSIPLVDSASVFTCPYVRAVYSKFGYRRGRRHQGVDLPLPVGTPVKVAFDGRVRAAMYSKGYGNLVVVRHENGLETYYGHLSKRLVEPGDWVHSGDVIGLGGSTGRSTGPHLHFETRYRGFAFDPQWIIDFEAGELRKNVFVLRRSYLDASSRYVPQSIDEEEEIYATDEAIEAEEKRIAAEKAAMRWHTVRSGETISGIAIKNGVSQAKIKELNPGLNINKIRVGQKIRVN